MITVVLPAHNEASRLETCITEIRKYLEPEDEILIAEDGSTDRTYEIAKRLAMKDRKIMLLHADKKLGRGLALKRAFSKARGARIIYIDVDLATNPRHIAELVKKSADFDVVTGSRYIYGAATERPFARKFFSLGYNFLIRMLTGCNIKDSQCGFKAFSRTFVKNEIGKISETSWAWDTVVMVEAARKGYSICEIPVEWKEKKERAHSSSAKRILKDMRLHGFVLLKLFAKWRLGLDVRV